jgi:hypothetical protein
MKFNFEYIISILSALFASFIVYRANPAISPLIPFFIVPLLVAYLAILTINNVFPQINRIGKDIKNFVEDRIMTGIDTTDYYYIFPPIMFVFVLFVVLLYLGYIN